MSAVLRSCVLASILGGLAAAAMAQDEAIEQAVEKAMEEGNQCAVCHGTPDLWEGETLRLYTPLTEWQADVHNLKGVKCADCHGGNADTFEVRQAHAQEDGFRTLQGPQDIPAFCGRCHSDPEYMRRFQPAARTDVVQRFWNSVHGEHLKRQPKPVADSPEQGDAGADNAAQVEETSQTEAEAAQPTDDPSSDASPDDSADDSAETAPQPDAEASADSAADSAAEVDADGSDSLAARPSGLPASHAALPAATCTSCHEKHGMRPQTDPQSLIHPNRLAETCGKCHEAPLRQMATDVHSKVGATGGATGGATNGMLACTQCHGQDVHGMLPVNDLDSPVALQNQIHSCGRCHEKSLATFVESVHGHGLLKSGLLTSAVCSSCHGAHGIFKAADERSLLHAGQVSETCGKCHLFIEQRLATSVHGGSGLATLSESSGRGAAEQRKPSCTDCHQGHDLPNPSSATFRQAMSDRCGNCHSDLSERYGFSLHGQLTRLGDAAAAKCSDCHGAHEILPVNHPDSRVSGDQRVATCRQCHPRANASFASFDPHADHHDPERSPLLFYVFRGMETLLIVVFGFFGVHTLLWFWRSWLQRVRSGIPRRLVPGTKAYVRFERVHRLTHLLIIVSFLGLALTGLPLKYSSQPWARWLATALGGFESTSFWHRICAVITFGYFLSHLLWLAGKIQESRRAHMSWRQIFLGPDSPVPTFRDFKDVLAMGRWFLIGGKKPTFDRWSYWEKFDYWAVFWGVAIIGASGLILWFPEFFSYLLPGQAINIAKIIHSEEALLATGFIFTIHFFNTHLRGEKFPMDLSMLTGLVSAEELADERPEFVERMRAAGKLDELQADVPDRRTLRLTMLGGFIALLIGFGLLAGMVAAMVF